MTKFVLKIANLVTSYNHTVWLLKMIERCTQTLHVQVNTRIEGTVYFQSYFHIIGSNGVQTNQFYSIHGKHLEMVYCMQSSCRITKFFTGWFTHVLRLTMYSFGLIEWLGHDIWSADVAWLHTYQVQLYYYNITQVSANYHVNSTRILITSSIPLWAVTPP